MKIVTCTGYFSTGSSAVGDLLSEFDNCYSPNDYELRFIYDPDGLSDLEYHLVDNHNRHNSGHALKRYKHLVDFYCGNKIAKKNEWYFKGYWRKLSYNYIDSLTDFTYNGSWLYDYLDKGTTYHYFNSFLRKLFKKDLQSKSVTYCSYPSREEFLEKTKKYLNELFSVVCDKNTKIAVFDQLLPPSDIGRYVRYFDDIFVFVVDRDPRDVFMLEKYIRKEKVLPTNVEEFCRWFEFVRRHRKKEAQSEKSLFLSFEDLVYKYDETVDKIIKSIGLTKNEHTRPFSRFNPNKSINNTQIWKRVDLSSKIKEEIDYIEKHLRDFLYDFPETKILINKKNRIE